MRVQKHTISGTVYDFEGSRLSIFESKYGRFVFEGEGLEHLDGRVKPYHLNHLEGKLSSTEEKSVSVYSTEEQLFFPVKKVDAPWQNGLFVVDEEFVVRVGAFRSTEPNVIGMLDWDDVELAEVYTVTLQPVMVREQRPRLVQYRTLLELFENSKVEEVKLV